MSALSSHPFSVFIQDLPNQKKIFQQLSILQTQPNLNANLFLFSIWYAFSEQGKLRRPEFKKLDLALHPWHEKIVLALQQLSNSLHHSPALQQQVQIETEMANQFEQEILGQVVFANKKLRRNNQQKLNDATFNLVTYYKIMRFPLDKVLRENTEKILQLFFPENTQEEIIQSFNQAIQAARLEEPGYVQLSLV